MLHAQLAALVLAAATLAASGCGKSSNTSAASATTTTGTEQSTGTSNTGTETEQSTSTSNTGTSTLAGLGPPRRVKVAVGTPLTRAALIAKGDAICREANKKLDTVLVVKKSETGRAYPQAAVYETEETNQLSKLVPPASMAGDWEIIISDFHRYVEFADIVARYSLAGQFQATMPYFQPAEKVHEEINAIAKRDGFKYCSGVK